MGRATKDVQEQNAYQVSHNNVSGSKQQKKCFDFVYWLSIISTDTPSKDSVIIHSVADEKLATLKDITNKKPTIIEPSPKEIVNEQKTEKMCAVEKEADKKLKLARLVFKSFNFIKKKNLFSIFLKIRKNLEEEEKRKQLRRQLNEHLEKMRPKDSLKGNHPCAENSPLLFNIVGLK